jgi:hypothetical protein
LSIEKKVSIKIFLTFHHHHKKREMEKGRRGIGRKGEGETEKRRVEPKD